MLSSRQVRDESNRRYEMPRRHAVARLRPLPYKWTHKIGDCTHDSPLFAAAAIALLHVRFSYRATGRASQSLHWFA